jgi:transcriptional regulator with XRE-family HTH domain
MSTNLEPGVIPEFTMGERLTKARKMTGLDQKQFADLIGVVRATISNAERDVYQPRPILLNAWSLVTGVPREWLETGRVPQSPTPQGLPRLDSNQQPFGPRLNPLGYDLTPLRIVRQVVHPVTSLREVAA